jgi:hypothetical protein
VRYRFFQHILSLVAVEGRLRLRSKAQVVVWTPYLWALSLRVSYSISCKHLFRCWLHCADEFCSDLSHRSPKLAAGVLPRQLIRLAEIEVLVLEAAATDACEIGPGLVS